MAEKKKTPSTKEKKELSKKLGSGGAKKAADTIIDKQKQMNDLMKSLNLSADYKKNYKG